MAPNFISPEDRSDACSLSLLREAIVRERDGHLGFVPWCLYYFAQLSQNISAERNRQPCQEIDKENVKWCGT